MVLASFGFPGYVILSIFQFVYPFIGKDMLLSLGVVKKTFVFSVFFILFLLIQP